MKILPLVALVLMGLTTIVSCKKEEKAAALPAAGEVTPVGGVKIVYVNIDSLLEGYDLYQEQKNA